MKRLLSYFCYCGAVITALALVLALPVRPVVRTADAYIAPTEMKIEIYCGHNTGGGYKDTIISVEASRAVPGRRRPPAGIVVTKNYTVGPMSELVECVSVQARDRELRRVHRILYGDRTKNILLNRRMY